MVLLVRAPQAGAIEALDLRVLKDPLKVSRPEAYFRSSGLAKKKTLNFLVATKMVFPKSIKFRNSGSEERILAERRKETKFQSSIWGRAASKTRAHGSKLGPKGGSTRKPMNFKSSVPILCRGPTWNLWFPGSYMLSHTHTHQKS